MTNSPQMAYASDLTFQVLSAAVSFMKSREADVTEREYIRAHRDVLVQALDNQKDCILAYFEHRFTERREALGEFYDLLHSAVESGDTSQLQLSLTGILGIIKDNPLEDLAAFREQWQDPNFSVEL